MVYMNKSIYDILDGIDIGVIILNKRHQVLLWNGYMEHITGKNDKEVAGKDFFEVFPNLNKNYFKKSIDRVIKSGYEMFFSAAMHKRQISNSKDLNIKISRVENCGKKLIVIEFIDVTNQLARIKQLREYIKKLYLLNKELKEKEKTIQKLAYYDNLTGVANRALFYKFAEKILSKAKRNNSIFGLLLIDVDNFKEINDTYGHKIGDDVLIEVAKILTKCTRKSDIVSRFGGDEFLILLSEIRDYADCKIVTSRILNERNKTVKCNGIEINISLSIGISFYPKDGKNICDLMTKADEAMYINKKSNRLKNTV